MQEIVITLPEETLLALHVTAAEAAREVQLVAAIKLYELGRLSSGAAAQLAGIPRPLFLSKLGDYGVPTFSLTDEELDEEMAIADRYL